MEIVLTVIARDRPGLVETISETITKHSGNWVDSSMARLEGQFAGILSVSVPDSAIESLTSDLESLGNEGIEIQIRTGSEKQELPAGRYAYLELTGADHPGIVHEVSRTLSKFDVNVEALKTEIFSASMSGNPMFSAQAEIFVPAELELGTLTDELELIANDLMVEIDLKDDSG